jgi:hypothetical protein
LIMYRTVELEHNAAGMVLVTPLSLAKGTTPCYGAVFVLQGAQGVLCIDSCSLVHWNLHHNLASTCCN